MPLFDYVCKKCNHSFETLVFNGETPQCPECRSKRLEKQLSVPAKPREGAATSLPMGCDPERAPCGPHCPRL